MFTRWLDRMVHAIDRTATRTSLSLSGRMKQETNDSPNPHFFGGKVDFTCVNNCVEHDLVWDDVMTERLENQIW